MERTFCAGRVAVPTPFVAKRARHVVTRSCHEGRQQPFLLQQAAGVGLAAALAAALALAPAAALTARAQAISSEQPPLEQPGPSQLEEQQAAKAAPPLEAPPTAAPGPRFTNDVPIVDEARLIPRGQLPGVQQQLKALETETGWRVRVLSHVGKPADSLIDRIRSGWKVDGRTVVVLADPTSGNMFTIKYGQDINAIMPQRFFNELQTRYGNLYYVRENGEGRAMTGLLDSLAVCLRKGGCIVVPGLVPDQYYLTLGTTVAGGLVFGATSRIEPQGFVQRKWVWPLLFFPLWGTLFITFGMGPILARTSDPLPIIQNCVAFAAAAATVAFAPGLAWHTGLRPWSDRDINQDNK